MTTYYTTSIPININEFIAIEVIERKNYLKSDVKKWIKKYSITTDSKLLWVALYPHMAARYSMKAGDWDRAQIIYNKNPKKYKVKEITENQGTIIEESDDGDYGYIMILNKKLNESIIMETIELKISNVFENLEEFFSRVVNSDNEKISDFLLFSSFNKIKPICLFMFKNLRLLTDNNIFDYTLSDVDAIEEVWISDSKTLLATINTEQNQELFDDYKTENNPNEYLNRD